MLQCNCQTRRNIHIIKLVNLFLFIIFNLQLRDFMRLRELCDELSKNDDQFKFDEGFWNDLGSMVKVFDTIYIEMKKMQAVQFTLSDFYISWRRIQNRLQNMNLETNAPPLINHLLESMKRRYKSLFDVPVMEMAIFLDPRLAIPELVAEIGRGEEFVKDLHKKVIKDDMDSGSNDDSLENLFAAQSGTPSAQELSDEIQEYKLIPRLMLSESVLEFWKINKEKFPHLYRLATIVMAVSPTQVSVERAFSAFGFIYSNRRQKLKPIHVQELLNIRLNRELFNRICEEESKECLRTE